MNLEVIIISDDEEPSSPPSPPWSQPPENSTWVHFKRKALIAPSTRPEVIIISESDSDDEPENTLVRKRRSMRPKALKLTTAAVVAADGKLSTATPKPTAQTLQI